MEKRMDQLFKFPEVTESFRHLSEQDARDLVLVYQDTAERMVVYLTHDDQKWLWLKESGWEPCFFTDDQAFGEVIKEKYGYYQFDTAFIDQEGVTQYLYREYYESQITGERLHPLFVALMDQLAQLPTDDKINNPEYSVLMHRALGYAPESMKAMMNDKARELGLMPEASGYTNDGQPVFTLQAIAEQLGMTEDEVITHIQDIEAKTGQSILMQDTPIHRKH